MENQGKYITEDEETSSDHDVSSSDGGNTEAEQKSFSAMVYRNNLLVAFVLLLGIGVSTAFLAFGLHHAEDDSNTFFTKRSSELVQVVGASWKDYVNAALSAHNYCRRSHNTSREEWREFYEYLLAGGLEFESIQCSPNITRDMRA